MSIEQTTVCPIERDVPKEFWLSTRIYDKETYSCGYSFVIVCRREPIVLKRNLNSLFSTLWDQTTQRFLFPFEIVIVCNDDDKNSETASVCNEALLAWQQAGCDVGQCFSLLMYPFHISKPGLEHYVTSVQSVHSFVYLRQWAMQHCKFSRVCRWDADFYMTKEFAIGLSVSLQKDSDRDYDEWRFNVTDSGGITNNEPRIVSMYSKPLYKKYQLWEVVDYLQPKRKSGHVEAVARRDRNISVGYKSHYLESPWWYEKLQGKRNSTECTLESAFNLALAEETASKYYALKHFLPRDIQLFCRGSDPKADALCRSLPIIEEHLSLQWFVHWNLSNKTDNQPVVICSKTDRCNDDDNNNTKTVTTTHKEDVEPATALIDSCPENFQIKTLSLTDVKLGKLIRLESQGEFLKCIARCNKFCKTTCLNKDHDVGKMLVESSDRWKATTIKRRCMQALGKQYYIDQALTKSLSLSIDVGGEHPLKLADWETMQNCTHVFTITTCKRLDLFFQTMISFLTNTDVLSPMPRGFETDRALDSTLVGKESVTLTSSSFAFCPLRWADTVWLCVDDNSSEEDRKKMLKELPFVHFVFRDQSQKGHRKGMNVLWQWVLTHCPQCRYVIHLEDDWLFVGNGCGEKLNILENAMRVLSSRTDLGQVLFNPCYDEEPGRVSGGYTALPMPDLQPCSRPDHSFDRYLVHEHCDTSELRRLHPINHGWWPHYSLRPGITRVDVYKTVGKYNEDYKRAPNFEYEYGTRYINKGWKTGFLDIFSSWHLGPCTYQIRNEEHPNAYILNTEP